MDLEHGTSETKTVTGYLRPKPIPRREFHPIKLMRANLGQVRLRKVGPSLRVLLVQIIAGAIAGFLIKPLFGPVVHSQPGAAPEFDHRLVPLGLALSAVTGTFIVAFTGSLRAAALRRVEPHIYHRSPAALKSIALGSLCVSLFALIPWAAQTYQNAAGYSENVTANRLVLLTALSAMFLRHLLLPFVPLESVIEGEMPLRALSRIRERLIGNRLKLAFALTLCNALAGIGFFMELFVKLSVLSRAKVGWLGLLGEIPMGLWILAVVFEWAQLNLASMADALESVAGNLSVGPPNSEAS